MKQFKLLPEIRLKLLQYFPYFKDFLSLLLSGAAWESLLLKLNQGIDHYLESHCMCLINLALTLGFQKAWD